MGTCLTNKYAEGYPGKRYYGGCEVVDKIETLAIERLKLLFGAEYANVQPHSGAQANAAIFLSVLKAGDPILGFDLSHGGHLSHGSPVNFSGKVFSPFFYGVEKDSGLIDMDKVDALAQEHKPKLIVCGASAYSRDWDYERFRAIADSVGALLLADIAHPAGLICKGLLNDPLPHCHIVSSTTHKTLRGPRGGIIMMGKDFENPWGRTTKKVQGGPLEHVIASKAVAFAEALDDSFKVYGQQVIKNAHVMAESFVQKGYKVISGGTDNHLMLIDLRSKSVTGKEAEKALVSADITVNKNMVPYDDKSPFVTSGIRIGSAAVTTRGMQEEHCLQLVEWIDEVVTNHTDTKKIDQVRGQVNKYMEEFPLYQDRAASA
ncbi:UNVERIFIED_CONTAM: hypothetical protein GTU68_053521 [Idotea baltica]|nr:hypothetical protein [Idotea baltica]